MSVANIFHISHQLYSSKHLSCLMMCTNNRVHHDLEVVNGYVHITLPNYHHYADLPEGIEQLVSKMRWFAQLSLMMRDYQYVILSSSNWKYDPFAIV